MNAHSPIRSAFDLQRIREETWVCQIDYHWRLESTNSHALQLAELPETQTPLLVLTEDQTEGRGRGGHRWWSTTGSLTFSVLTNLEEVLSERISLLSLTVGLSVCQAIERLVPVADVGLKWPNDVYLNGRKLAGVLIELPALEPPRGVLGVGINVNNSFQGAPPEITATATSLRDCLEQELDLNDVLIHSLQELQLRLEDLRGSSAELADQWQAYHILQGRQVRLNTDAHQQLDGICLGIDDDGALLLQTDEGVERCLGGVVTRFG